jgi:hypothetical protein
MNEKYERLRAFLRSFPRDCEKKKDLLGLPSQTRKEYIYWVKYFNIDGRMKPLNVIRELRMFKKDNIYFKSEMLGYDLTKMGCFDKYDMYTSSKKVVSIVTNAMIYGGIKLKNLSCSYEYIDISYNRGGMRKIVKFDSENYNLDWVGEIRDSSIFVNIKDTAYNKSFMDFEYDYFNQSSDFVSNLIERVNNQEIYFFRW